MSALEAFETGSIISSGEWKLWLAFRPIDDSEKHSAPEHFGLKPSGVPFPVGRLPHAKNGVAMVAFEGIIGGQSAADSLVHHRKAFVRERLVVHQTRLT
jgi:hypothetical protein